MFACLQGKSLGKWKLQAMRFHDTRGDRIIGHVRFLLYQEEVYKQHSGWSEYILLRVDTQMASQDRIVVGQEDLQLLNRWQIASEGLQWVLQLNSKFVLFRRIS